MRSDVSVSASGLLFVILVLVIIPLLRSLASLRCCIVVCCSDRKRQMLPIFDLGGVSR